MTQPIAALSPHSPFRDPDAAPPVVDRDGDGESKVWFADGEASFGDALDAVNPLQHIPVVSSVYRTFSGDDIGLGARLIGGAIFGGPLGVIFAGISALFEEASGGNIADHGVAFVKGLTEGDEGGTGHAIAAIPDHAEGDASEGLVTAAAVVADAAAPTETPIEAAVPAPAPPPVAAMPADKPARETVVPAAAMQQLDSESRRIARALWDSQRAQANLLFANLRSQESAVPKGAGENLADGAVAEAPHVNLPPTDARADWYADAMQRALDKYQADARESGSGS